MKIILVEDIKTKEEARQLAIEWQSKQSKKSLSNGQLANGICFFYMLAKKFRLITEFKENGII